MFPGLKNHREKQTKKQTNKIYSREYREHAVWVSQLLELLFFPLNFLPSLTATNDIKSDHWMQVRNFKRHFHSFYNQHAPWGSYTQLNCLLHAVAPYLAVSALSS